MSKIPTVVNCFKFEKIPAYLDTFEDKEFVYIGLVSQVGGEMKIRCDFSKSMPGGLSSANAAEELKEKNLALYEANMLLEEKSAGL